MIKSFKCKETEEVFHRHFSRKLPQHIQSKALQKLWILNRAPDLHTLSVPPGNYLENLRGPRKGQHSIRINDQWRICFVWKDQDAYDVEIVDYH
ncbi:MAG: type II toxin-antitoxin system RelE/ParE family toxin [Deltaproteobacteria bacterium]|nr:type II toxin-antitoxin system RelE/ParE family toxin [Deltaproteobacteria bacterium]